MSSIPKNWSTTSLSENWKFGRNSWVEILVRSFTVLGAHEMREGKCILVSILMCGLRKSELYLAWLLWQLVLPSDWAEFCYKWMSRIQISSTLRRHRRQSGLMTEGIHHWWNQRTLGPIGHRNSAIEHFIYMERKAYKILDQDRVAIWELTMELFRQCFHGLPWFWDMQNARNTVVRTLELVQQMQSEGRGCNQSMLFFVGMPNASMCPLHTGTGWRQGGCRNS